MDILDPIIGGIFQLDPSALPAIGKGILRGVALSIPFLLLGIYLEKGRGLPLTAGAKTLKVLLLGLFTLPLFLLGGFNLAASRLPDAFWDEHPGLENLWIIEGDRLCWVLLGVTGVFFLLYLLEILRGDLTR